MRSGETRQIDAHTRLLALLGQPVSHSLSPRLHNAALAALGLNLAYLAFDVAPADLPAAIRGLRGLGFAGANLTVPHKQAVLPLLDEIDEMAARVGAVNTITNQAGRLRGYNTDVDGFRAALRRAWGRVAQGANCLVLGAGGAARAVVAALGQEAAAEILLYNRTAETAVQLCTVASSWSATPCRPVTQRELSVLGADLDLVVNATTVGLGATVKENPLPADIVSERHFVMDLVYGSETTGLLSYARSRGAVGVDGREMLLQQAARAFELWTGHEPPLEVMRREMPA